MKIPVSMTVLTLVSPKSAMKISLFLIIASVGSLLTSTATAQSTSSFTSAERSQLRRGRLVTRNETEMRDGLRLIGGTAFQVINAPPEVVWRAVMDIERWNRFVPQVVESRTVSSASGRKTIYLRHEHGPVEAAYHLRLTHMDSQRMAQFRLDRTRRNDLREGWGFFIVAPFGNGKTMITFGVMADVGSGIITGLVRPTVHEWMLRIPQQLKSWVEGAGRRRYARD